MVEKGQLCALLAAAPRKRADTFTPLPFYSWERAAEGSVGPTAALEVLPSAYAENRTPVARSSLS